MEIEERTEMRNVAEGGAEDFQEVKIEKNSGEKALVRILIPKKKITQSEIDQDREEGVNSDAGDTERLVDVDQDEKALAVARTQPTLDYSVYVINHYA